MFNSADSDHASPFEVLTGGLVNLVVGFESAGESWVARVHTEGAPPESTTEVLEFLCARGIAVPRPKRARDGSAAVPLEGWVLTVYERLRGTLPGRDTALFRRAGRFVAQMQDALLGFGTPKGPPCRFTKALRDRDAILQKIAAASASFQDLLEAELLDALPAMLDSFRALRLDDTAPLLPTHTDIFRENLLDDGAGLALLDFDYLAPGLRIWDALSFPAWEAFDTIDHSLRLDWATAYFRGYRETSQWAPDLDCLADHMAFLNLAENIYNLEKTLREGTRGYPHYLANWRRTRMLLENRDALEAAWKEALVQ